MKTFTVISLDDNGVVISCLQKATDEHHAMQLTATEINARDTDVGDVQIICAIRGDQDIVPPCDDSGKAAWTCDLGLTPADSENYRRERAFEAAAEAQTAFWKALSTLEEALEVEIDGTRDLNETSVEALLDEDEDDDEEADAARLAAADALEARLVPTKTDDEENGDGRPICTDVRCSLRADHKGPCSDKVEDIMSEEATRGTLKGFTL